MSDNPFAFGDGARPRRDPRPARKSAPAAGGRAGPWVLGGAALVVLTGVGVGLGLYLARQGERPGGGRAGTEQAAVGRSEKNKGTRAQAPPGGDLPAELLARARTGMAVFDIASDDGHRDRGAGFFLGDGAEDILVGFDPIMLKHKLGPQGRRYPEIALHPEDIRRSGEDLHFFSPGSQGRSFLIVRNPKKLPGLELAEDDPRPDDEVFVLGYSDLAPEPAAFRVDHATVGAKMLTAGTDYSFDLRFAPPANYVFGGPVLDRQGRVVGAVLPPAPGKQTASLFPIDLIKAIHKGNKTWLDAGRNGPATNFKPKPPEVPTAAETGGLDAAVFLRVKDALGEVTAADGGFIINSACVVYYQPDRVLTHGQLNVSRSKVVYKEGGTFGYSMLGEDRERTPHGGAPKVLLADDALNVTVLSVDVKKRKPGLELSPEEVKVGDAVWALGRGKLQPGEGPKPRQYRARAAKVTGVEGAKGKSPTVGLDFAAGSDEWKFGGPVVDARGRVVGVLLPPGKDEKTARIVPATAIRKALAEKKLLGADGKGA